MIRGFAPRQIIQLTNKMALYQNPLFGLNYETGQFLSQKGRFRSTLGWSRLSVVYRINTFVVQRAVKHYPVRLIYSASIGVDITTGKCASEFNPAILLSCDRFDFIDHLRKILILTKHYGNVIMLFAA